MPIPFSAQGRLSLDEAVGFRNQAAGVWKRVSTTLYRTLRIHGAGGVIGACNGESLQTLRADGDQDARSGHLAGEPAGTAARLW